MRRFNLLTQEEPSVDLRCLLDGIQTFAPQPRPTERQNSKLTRGHRKKIQDAHVPLQNKRTQMQRALLDPTLDEEKQQ